MTEFTYPCEQCGDNVPESKAELIEEPAYRGSTILAFCDQCQE